MIKMYIGGEEVVSDKEFTIKEEMLSTSSTILNNCYPKSWEQDHDYTSRFYYPKDYSQCLINRVEDEQTLTQNGTTISFDNLINPTLEDIKLYGNTLQNGIPTPDNPINVETITSEQTIQVSNNGVPTNYTIDLGSIELCKINNFQDKIIKNTGKNLWGGLTSSFTRSTSGMSFVSNTDGTIQVGGTATASVASTTNTLVNNNNYYISLPAGTYTLSGGLSSGIRVQVYKKDDTSNYLANDTGNGATFTLTETTNVYARAYIINGTVVPTKTVLRPQIEKGSRVTSYEPYGSGDWYVWKNIIKHIFDGSSDDSYLYNTDLADVVAINLNPNKLTNSAYKVGTSTSGSWIISDNFIYEQSTANREHLYITAGVNLGNNEYYGNIRLYVAHSRLTGYSSSLTNDEKMNLVISWLQDNPIIAYYVDRYATYTQITDNTLISQLENISIIKGNNQITTEINSLAFNIDMTVYDNGTELLFAGMVKNSGNISLNPRYPKYCALEILDFKDFLSTGEYLDFVISNKTVIEAIQMVVDAVAQYGFVLGNVNILGGDDIIGAYSTQEKSAYDVFQYLADITQSRWTTRMIDENTIAIDFYDPTLMPQGQDIEYTKEWWETNQVNDLKFSYGSRDYRNKQVILSSQVYGGTDYSETILGDGYNKNFNTTENIGIVKAIYVNGTEVSFATNVDKELGIETDFYYTPGENIISSNESQSSYSAGTQIIVTYTPLVKGREVIYNTDEVNRINTQLGRKGVVARYEQRNDVLYTEDLEKIGQSYIKYKGSAEVILTLTTQVDIYNVGEVVYFNAPIQDLIQDYMVKRKSTQIIVTGNFSNVWYTYELTSSFNSETAINWFDNQRNKTNGNISEGEYITRNIDIENTATIIWDNLTITEVIPSGDNILNSVLNSPFTQ